MQTSREILADVWKSAGGDIAALDAVRLSGEEPQLPSSFRVAAAAQVSIAASGLAAAEIWKMRSGQAQNVAVDMRHATVECRSERYLRVDGKPPPPAWDAIAGVYRTGDGRFVRLHTNFAHHRAAVCQVLDCKAERDDVQAARTVKPDFDAVVMKHMGHYPMLERPAEFNRRVAEIVASLDKR